MGTLPPGRSHARRSDAAADRHDADTAAGGRAAAGRRAAADRNAAADRHDADGAAGGVQPAGSATLPPTGIMPTVPGGVQPPIGTLPPDGVMPTVPGGVQPPIATLPPGGVMPTLPGGVQPPIATLPPGRVTPARGARVASEVEKGRRQGEADGRLLRSSRSESGTSRPQHPALPPRPHRLPRNCRGRRPRISTEPSRSRPGAISAWTNYWNAWTETYAATISDRRFGLDMKGRVFTVTSGSVGPQAEPRNRRRRLGLRSAKRDQRLQR